MNESEKPPHSPPLRYFFWAGVVFAITSFVCSRLFNHWGEFKLWVLKLFS